MVSQKEKVVKLLQSIETGNKEPINYINPKKYIQHNLGIKDGLEGFALLLNHPDERFKVDIVRVFEDRDKVFTHTQYDFFGPKIGFDIFRFEEGLIVEHWDNLTKVIRKTASGRTQINGASKIKNQDETENNKALIKEFYTKILIKNQYDEMSKFFDGDNYLQHNPLIPDGVSNLINTLSKMAEEGNAIDVQKIHYLMGEGNFILVVGEGVFVNEPTAFYDLFRVENNKIIEHWDVISKIPPKEEWLNNNGKF